jgi:glutamyl-tRNA synthetase
MNFQYLKLKDLSELASLLKPTLESKGYKGFSDEYISKVIGLLRERVKFLHEIPDFGNYMFVPPTVFDKEYLEKYWNEGTGDLIISLLEILKQNEDYSHSNLHDLTKNFIEGKGMKLKEIIHPLRLMITGVSAGAGMFETMEVLGKEQCINRIEYFLKHRKNL